MPWQPPPLRRKALEISAESARVHSQRRGRTTALTHAPGKTFKEHLKHTRVQEARVRGPSQKSRTQHAATHFPLYVAEYGFIRGGICGSTLTPLKRLVDGMGLTAPAPPAPAAALGEGDDGEPAAAEAAAADPAVALAAPFARIRNTATGEGARWFVLRKRLGASRAGGETRLRTERLVVVAVGVRSAAALRARAAPRASTCTGTPGLLGASAAAVWSCPATPGGSDVPAFLKALNAHAHFRNRLPAAFLVLVRHLHALPTTFGGRDGARKPLEGGPWCQATPAPRHGTGGLVGVRRAPPPAPPRSGGRAGCHCTPQRRCPRQWSPYWHSQLTSPPQSTWEIFQACTQS